ncbi:scm-like with four MBT domains protein 2 [Gadus chalcogrammus]|uniref:scm-like with four MBT domains protein 2 n=1 Tax=Gadus chalcogrammus TaxID=1042646 RepID=UPI0024C4AAB9|nr:scm-like with four MBT domains protein 2 [Gadus chalcogrammus]XP_056434387.1 scm-like with four MBT domains protein 2 [Gadus chalcogrammus]
MQNRSHDRSLARAAGRFHPSTNGKEEEIPTDGGSAEEEAEFNWEEYMEESGTSAAPHTAFKHVETSLRSSFQPGMKLEVANRAGADTYWVATIVTTCGQLLLLRYCGYGADRKADFWCDVMTAELHPVGWCTANGKTLAPPQDNLYLRKAIKEKFSDWTDFLVQELTGSRTAPANLLEGPMRGKNTVDLVVEASLMEVRDPTSPALYWPARVVRNVGGRLRLRYVGLGGGGGDEDPQGRDFWLFYLDTRLRPLGWASENSLSLEPPTELRSLKSAPEWQEALEAAQQEAQAKPLPLEVFKDHTDPPRHSFSTGMKLEMVSPWKPLCICPVSVTKVYDEFYFQVTADDLSPEATPTSLVCSALTPGILPVQWSLKQGVGMERPGGYAGQDFDWADYLKHSGTEAAPDTCFPDEWKNRDFSKDTWLEAVNPLVPSEVCVAKVTQVKGRLMWLLLEGVSKGLSECIADVESMDIFPVGWCEANGYTLTTPHKPVCQNQKKIAVVQPEKQLAPPPPIETAPTNTCPPLSVDPGSANGRYCCSKIFINHRCFSGPYLNKGRIAELPQAVGPGKCSLVLKEVLTMLTNAAYKPGRVLKELQEVEDQSWECHEEILKAKYKGKPYRATMPIVRLAEQIPDFCRRVCLRLQCCPNLFSPTLVTDKCPENCSMQTKTKYTYYYGKKRKLPKPVGGEELSEADPSKPARRRKKRKAIFVQRKRRSSAVDYTPASSLQDSDEEEDDDEEDMDFQSGSEESAGSRQRGAPAAAPPLSTRPRRAASLRRGSLGGGGLGASGGSTEGPEGRRRSARSLAAYGQNNKNNNNNNEDENYTPPGNQETKMEGVEEQEEDGQLVLERNPLEWSVDEVVQFITSTDCASLANIFQEQDIDGQALLLLTLPTVQECMDLKLGPAIKLCHQIERVKVAFYRQYAN